MFQENKTIYELELHEKKTIYDGMIYSYVTRVHRGWIYTSMNLSHNVLSETFVPDESNRHN